MAKGIHTPGRAVRVPDALWEAAQAAAEENGESVSDVIRKALEAYVKRARKVGRGADACVPGHHHRFIRIIESGRVECLWCHAPRGQSDEGGAA